MAGGWLDKAPYHNNDALHVREIAAHVKQYSRTIFTGLGIKLRSQITSLAILYSLFFIKLTKYQITDKWISLRIPLLVCL